MTNGCTYFSNRQCRDCEFADAPAFDPACLAQNVTLDTIPPRQIVMRRDKFQAIIAWAKMKVAAAILGTMEAAKQ